MDAKTYWESKGVKIYWENEGKKMKTKLRVLRERILVKRTKASDRSAGGLYLPEAAQEKPSEGVVLATGDGLVFENGGVRPMLIKAGDKIIFGKYSGTEVKIDGEELVVMKEDDVITVVEEVEE